MSVVDSSFSKLSPSRERQSAQASSAAGSFLRAMEVECDRIRDSDPSLIGGYQIIYDREVPFEIRAAEAPGDESAGAYEGLMVKILVQSAAPNSSDNTSNLVPDHQHNASSNRISGGTVDVIPPFTSLRVELSSETDLFFHYTCAINQQGYNMLREDQKLTCSFQEFAGSVVRMFNRCIQEPQALVAVALLGADASATLQIIQNFDYKLVEVLALPFRESPQDLVRCHVEYRYRAIRSRLAIMTSKLHDVAALVRVRDSALLPVLQQSTSTTSGTDASTAETSKQQ